MGNRDIRIFEVGLLCQTTSFLASSPVKHIRSEPLKDPRAGATLPLSNDSRFHFAIPYRRLEMQLHLSQRLQTQIHLPRLLCVRGEREQRLLYVRCAREQSCVLIITIHTHPFCNSIGIGLSDR